MNNLPLRSGLLALPALFLLALVSGCAAPGNQPPASATAAATPATVIAPDGGIADDQIRDVVRRVARHQLVTLAEGDYSPVTSVAAAQAAKAPAGLAWVYPWGVTLYGAESSTDVTGDQEVGQFVTRHNQICARYYTWLAGLKDSVADPAGLSAFTRTVKIKNLVVLGSLDSCGAMGNELLEDLIRHPDQATAEEKQVVERVADWILHRQDRLPDGTLWRPKSMNGTLWPDDLYMGGVFLARYSRYTHDPKYAEDAANQIIHQAEFEADDDGLWFHGYFVRDHLHAPLKWGRGNGWVTVALVETLSALPEKDSLRPQLLKILRAQIAGLKKVQAPDGMWRQVLDKPELWEETSCTAMFAYGIARAANRGWIDAGDITIARHAFAALATRVTADGGVNGTCVGTNIGRDLDFYAKRTQPDDDLHGRGVVLLAGTELLRAGKK